MKRKTRLELIDELNKVSQEKSYYFSKVIDADNKIKDLTTQIVRERELTNKLLDIMRMGAQEGNFPRRANNG